MKFLARFCKAMRARAWLLVTGVLSSMLLLESANAQTTVTLGEALNATNLTWVTSSSPPWTAQTLITHDDDAAAEWTSHRIPNQSWLETTVAGPLAVTFWWKSETPYNDSLNFYISSNIQASVGSTDWQRRSFFVSNGVQVLRWSVSQWGSAWLDEVSLEEPIGPQARNGPTNQTIPAGEPLLLSPQLIGTEPLSLQWRHFETNVPSATNASFFVADAQAGDAGDYSLLLANPLSNLTSHIATVAVLSRAPVFTVQPSPPPTAMGSNVTLSAGAKGSTPIFWQWFFDGQPVLDATNSSLLLTNLDTSQNGTYVAVASNAFGSTESEPSTLVVVQSPVIATQPNLCAAPPGGRVSLTANAYGPEPMGWQWFLNRTAISGSVSNSLILNNVKTGDYGEYFARVENAYGSATTAVATLTYSPVWTWEAASPYGSFATVPPSATNLAGIAAGDSHVLALRPEGSLLAWGGDYDGQTEIPADATNIVAIGAGGSHTMALRHDGKLLVWGKVHNDFRRDTYSIVRSEGDIGIPPTATNIVALAENGTAEHILVLRQDGVPIGWGNTNYGLCLTPRRATNVVQVAAGAYHSLALRSDGSVVAWGCNDGGQIAVPPTATNVVSLAGGSYFSAALTADGRLVVWGSSSYFTNVPAAATNIVEFTCNAHNILALRTDGKVIAWGDNWDTGLPVPVGATNLSTVRALFFGGLGVEAEGTPFITAHPLSSKAAAGETFRFLGNAIGARPLHYQWYRDGMPLPGMTQRWMLLTNVQSAAGEAYTFVASNSFAAVTSRVAKITSVTPSAPRVVSLPQLLPVPTNGMGEVSVMACGSEPLTFQWLRNGTNLVDTDRFIGSASNTLAVQSFRPEDAGPYAVRITNAYGALTSAVVTIRAATPTEAVAMGVDTQTNAWSPAGSTWFWQNQVTHDGEDAIQSRPEGFSWVTATVKGPTTIYFWWKVSSATNANYLSFSAGYPISASISGEIDWEQRSFALTSSGTYSLTWTYQKNSSLATGQDCGWIDELSFGPPTPPRFDTAPRGGAVTQGSNFTFSPHVSGTEPFAFQWQKNGTNWIGRTSESLTIANAQAKDTGNYCLMVSNVTGAVYSPPVPLVTIPPGAVGQPFLERRTNGTLLISWMVGTLESAPNIKGPWSEVPGAQSPVSCTIEEEARFFRVRLR